MAKRADELETERLYLNRMMDERRFMGEYTSVSQIIARLQEIYAEQNNLTLQAWKLYGDLPLGTHIRTRVHGDPIIGAFTGRIERHVWYHYQLFTDPTKTGTINAHYMEFLIGGQWFDYYGDKVNA